MLTRMTDLETTISKLRSHNFVLIHRVHELIDDKFEFIQNNLCLYKI
jgi:hypothetical protein